MANGKDNAVEVHLRKAKLAELDRQAADLESMYQVYRTLRKVTRKPGDLAIDFEIRGGKGTKTVSEKGVTRERVLADAARFRILRGIKEHVIANVGDIQSFDLAFDLKCRQVPEEIEIDIADQLGGKGPLVG